MTELHAVANAIMRTKYELSEELALQHHYQPPRGVGRGEMEGVLRLRRCRLGKSAEVARHKEIDFPFHLYYRTASRPMVAVVPYFCGCLL